MRNLLIYLLLFNVCNAFAATADTVENRWDKYFKRKLFDPPAGFVVESLNFLPGNGSGKVAVDLGSGIGHETMVLLKKGYKVVAVDSMEASFKYMKLQPGIQQYEQNLVPITASFEKLNFSTIPSADVVVASFSLPFVAQKNFNEVWDKVVNKIKPGGYFIGNLFHPDFTYFDKRFKNHMTFHSKEEALALFKGFKIIYFKEVQKPSLKPDTVEHYYVIFAKKIGVNSTVSINK